LFFGLTLNDLDQIFNRFNATKTQYELLFLLSERFIMLHALINFMSAEIEDD